MHHTLRNGFASLSSIARSHDDLPAFNAAYWVLTFLAAMLFNAGAFAVLLAGHMALDVYKYRDIHRKKWGKVAEGVARENLLDVSLLTLGITFSVYCHSSLPLVAGLRGLVRTEISLFNALVQVFVKVHVLNNVVGVLADVHNYLGDPHPRLGKKFSVLEAVSALGLGMSVTLLAAAPFLLGLDGDDVSRLAAELLVPWNL